MNWFYIAEYGLDKQSASFTHVLEFCNALSKVDKVTLISHTDPATLPTINEVECLQIVPINIPLHNLGYLLSTIKSFFFINHITIKDKPDMLYERSCGFCFGPLIAARIKHIPAVLEVNGNWEDEHTLALEHLSFPKRQLIALINSLRGYTVDLACLLANQIIVVTPNLAKFLRQKRYLNKKSILVAANGVNIERFTPLDSEACKKNVGLDPSWKYIGFIGSIAAWQGVEDLIIAYSNLPQEVLSGYRLLIVGDGSAMQSCKEIAHQVQLDKSVIFTGAQPYSSIPEYMGACSVLVAPKRQLSSGYSPLKIYEYLASARPILAANVDGLKFIEQERLGILFSPGDVDDLSNKLQAILGASDDEKKDMGERGRIYVVNNHSWDKVVQRIRDFVISDLMSKN